MPLFDLSGLCGKSQLELLISSVPLAGITTKVSCVHIFQRLMMGFVHDPRTLRGRFPLHGRCQQVKAAPLLHNLTRGENLTRGGLTTRNVSTLIHIITANASLGHSEQTS